jgi:lipopolysaccharide export system permease protein
VGSVVFVTIAFLSLFFFIDFVDELQDVGRNGYTLTQAVLVCFAEQPGHFYELFPIAVLIGTIFALARMAQSSEFTILRTGGLSPRRALTLLGALAAGFAIVNFLVGDFVVPWSERQVVTLHSQSQGGRDLGRTGAWLKDRRRTADGQERQVSVNVQRTASSGALQGVRIFEFTAQTGLRTRVAAERAQIGDGVWELENAVVTEWPVVKGPADALAVTQTAHARLRWPSNLDAGVVAAAVLPLATMSTIDLWRYSEHLSAQDQAATRHAIQFWKKALYPLSCFVMVALALPFAYLHARLGGISGKVFGGVLLGISFVLLNNVAGHLGVLREWTPWLAAAAPSALYFALSMVAFAWLIRYR